MYIDFQNPRWGLQNCHSHPLPVRESQRTSLQLLSPVIKSLYCGAACRLFIVTLSCSFITKGG